MLSTHAMTLRYDIIKEFSPKWELNDPAHRQAHFDAVLECGLYINSQHDNQIANERDIVLVAYFHDLFAWSRVNHHQLSQGYVITTDHPIFEGIADVDRDNIAYACGEHRASFKGNFSTALSQLMNAADRELPKPLSEMMERSFAYNRHVNPNLPEREVAKIVHGHMKEKYGRDGYARYPEIYLKAFQKQINKLHDEIDAL